MPRPLVLGNGSLLICIDEQYTIRDLYYPQVGLHNHLSGHPIRMGVWAGGKFCWCDEQSFEKELGYEPDTVTGSTTLTNEALGVRLQIREGVRPSVPHFIRQIWVENLTPAPLEVRIFFSHDLRIAGSDIGDTAYYNPFVDGVIHYKGTHCFLFGGMTAKGGIFEYATGIKDFGGMEGTWRDAEDGRLSQNPIAQGSVDSTVSLRLDLPPGAKDELLYWIVCGSSLEDVTNGYRGLLKNGPREALDEVGFFSRTWASKPVKDFESLPEDIQNLFKRSLLTIRTQIDNGGAVIAANDTDIMKTNRATYSYMWPRDGALVSRVMDAVGYEPLSRRFFRFCKSVLDPERPILMHKYRPDGSLGASWHPWIVDGKAEVPFQEDETALTIAALWHHYEMHQDPEFLLEMYEPFVVRTCDFMLQYRNPSTGLPLPSWDLWEERRGIHTFTVATLIAAMRAAAHIAAALGDERKEKYETATNELLHALETHMYDKERGIFYRGLHVLADGSTPPDRTVDASVLAVGLHGILPSDHPYVESTLRVVDQKLRVKSDVGGVARYEHDYYFRRTDAYPGNPWIICSLWFAQAKVMAAKKPSDLDEVMEWLNWASRMAASTGILAEQHDPVSGEPLSVSPLTWSHAEFVKTVLDYLSKYRSLKGLGQ